MDNNLDKKGTCKFFFFFIYNVSSTNLVVPTDFIFKNENNEK